MVIKTDMMQTVAIAIMMLYVGKYLRHKIGFFERFCIPAPVIGGFLFAIIHLLLRMNGIASFEMNTTLKDPFMMVFFTTIGLGANLDTLKKGGFGFIIFTILATILVVLQNVIGMGLAKALDQNYLLGLATGSITMVGGHGTAGAWGPTLEEMGLNGATTIVMAAATFGVIMGSLIGGPIGSTLIKRNKLQANPDDFVSGEVYEEHITREPLDERVKPPAPLATADFIKAMGVIFVCISLGVILKGYLQTHVSIAGSPLNLPSYVSSMIFAAIYVNTLGKTDKFRIDERANDILGDIGLNVFLVIALIGLNLLQLKAVAGPMLIILGAQTLVMALFAYFVSYYVMKWATGSGYDSAVLAGGICGFGMGATYNALANMDSITERYGPSPRAYFILPMVGAFAIDIINVLLITAFAQFKF